METDRLFSVISWQWYYLFPSFNSHPHTPWEKDKTHTYQIKMGTHDFQLKLNNLSWDLWEALINLTPNCFLTSSEVFFFFLWWCSKWTENSILNPKPPAAAYGLAQPHHTRAPFIGNSDAQNMNYFFPPALLCKQHLSLYNSQLERYYPQSWYRVALRVWVSSTHPNSF